MKKVLLVNTNTEIQPYPVPPIGLCLLAARIESKYIVRVFDGTFGTTEQLCSLAGEFNPDYIGISIRNIDNMVYQNRIVYFERIKSCFTDPLRKISGAKFIIGGSGFSIYPGSLLEYLGIDLGIAGEADESFPALLDHLDNNIEVYDLPGVVTRGSDTFKAALFKSPKKLNLPFADVDRFISFEPYRSRGAYPVQTKRGCSHKCIYCTYPLIEGTSYQIRDAGEVAGEIELAFRRLGNITFEFVDSTFNDPAGHAENICAEIIKRGIRPRLRTMGINPANSGIQLFNMMMKAGFSQIDCTPDSASPEMLKNLGKNFTLEQLIRTAELIGDNNLPTMWFFIFGGPGENEETFAETFDFIDRYINPEDMVHMTTGLRIYPGTSLHETAIKEGIVKPNDNLLKPVFYISPELGITRLEALIKDAARKRHFCVPSHESAPSPEMMKQALDLQSKMKVKEPMFRTLLRVRKTMMGTAD
jgi:radical SAM superfamily enzyme YgiQ (UPF0313 family)